MAKPDMEIVLASASPRRKALLGLLMANVTTIPSDIDEAHRPGEPPETYVARMAREKALACPESIRLVLAADTTVTLDNCVLGKPENHADARSTLTQLSGRSHTVYTAVALRKEDVLKECTVATQVTFADLSSALIESYLSTDEPWDKAGAYGIQGLAGSFVTAIDGSYSSVVGLPLAETRSMLAEFGVQPNWTAMTRG